MIESAIQIASETDPNLRMLDRGLDDIESGRILTHDDAMNEVRRIRQRRRAAREAGIIDGNVVNGTI